MKKSTVQHIWCNASIFRKMEDAFIAFVLNQSKADPATEYVLYLSTTGGSPFSGINLYNFVKSLPQKKTVYNMGNVDSAGIQFFLAFDNRYGVEDCSFMVHQTLLPRSALPDLFNAFDLQTEGDKLASTDKKTHDIIARETKLFARTSLSVTEIQQAALKSTTYHAKEALKHGFIESIKRPIIPSQGVFYITDQYLASLPG